MSTPPPDANPDDPQGENSDEFGDLEDEDVSTSSASDPESARQEAEDALAEIEALADLDEDPDASSASEQGPPESEGTATSDVDPSTADDKGALEDQCENCGAMLHGPYCSQCGQKAADRIVPIWHMINEALEAVVELDMRVLHTIPKFLFLPGRLTKEYINGRRKRYIRPFRLFLFATFLLFTVVAFSTTGGFGFLFSQSASGGSATTPSDTAAAVASDGARPAGATSGAEVQAGEPDTSGVPITRHSNLTFWEWLRGSQQERSAAADSIRQALTVNPSDDPMEASLKRNLPRVVEHPFSFIEATIDRGPYLMFFMVPIFALLLKLLYVRRGRLYVEHLIFSLHLHAFTFFAFTVGILLDQADATGFGVAATAVNASPLLYLTLAMAHVYDQGFIKSTVKAFILLLIYSFVLSIGFAVLILLVIAYLL